MVQQYGESFNRPTDPMTGEPIPGAPAMVVLSTTRPGGSGFVILRDEGGPPTAPSPRRPTNDVDGDGI